MSDDTRLPNGGGSRLTRAFRTMPTWKAGLLVASLVVGVIGAGAYVTAKSTGQKTVTVQRPVTVAPGGAVPPGASGFMGGGGTNTTDQPQTATVPVTEPAPPSLTEQYTPTIAKIGFSFFVGLIAGTISRVFLKLAAMLAALIVAGVAAAHYFNINLDLTAVKAQTGEATTWIHGQLDQLWAAVRNHLPSAGSATAGFLFGLKRR